MGLFVLSYLLGNKASKNYLEMAKLAKEQYKKENEEILRQQKLKEMRDNTAKSKARKIKKALEAEKEKRIKEMEKQKSNPDDVFEGIGIEKK